MSARAFAEYEKTVRAGVDIWREFILLYYQLPHLFFDLLSRPEARLQITQLLQGDVYDRASVPVLELMRTRIQAVADDKNHPWHEHLSRDLAGATAGA